MCVRMHSLLLIFLLSIPGPLVELGLADFQSFRQLAYSALAPIGIILPGLLQDSMLIPGESSPPSDVLLILLGL